MTHSAESNSAIIDSMNQMQHDAEILDQFTKQAEPFLRRHEHNYDELLELMAECTQANREDALLDVACGPGIVSCYFAERVGHVTGLDVVPAMLERAQRLQAERGLQNVDWRLAEATALPFAEGSFDCVITRFSFHHYMEPAAAIREMQRVSKPGGTIVVADVVPSAEAQDNFNQWEILRDRSHTRALTLAEMETLGEQAGLKLLRKANFSLTMKLETLLGSSFPKPGDADRIRALFEEDIEQNSDRLGVAARREEGCVWLTYPVAVLAWQHDV